MMKKIIAAALSILVGAFGYTIVDSAIENRVATLESEVVELREIISDYHKNITETIFTTISDNTKTSTQNPTTTKPLTPLQNWLVENHVAGYEYEPDGDFFYIDDEACWQSGKGYNEFYDKYAPAAAMFIDQIRIRFTYENKDWMIQLWKGWLFIPVCKNRPFWLCKLDSCFFYPTNTLYCTSNFPLINTLFSELVMKICRTKIQIIKQFKPRVAVFYYVIFCNFYSQIFF